MENCNIQDQQLTKRQMERAHLHFTDAADLVYPIPAVTNVTCYDSQNPLRYVSAKNDPLLWHIGSATGKRAQSTGHFIAEGLLLGPVRSWKCISGKPQCLWNGWYSRYL